MAVTVVSTSRFYAVQYIGGDEQEVAQDVRATEARVVPPDLILVAGWQRGSQLIQGHTFRVPSGWWVIWTDMDQRYVVDVLSPQEFAEQYQETCDCTTINADLAALESSKVDRAGDTMSGQLELEDGLRVSGGAINATYLGNDIDAMQTLALGLTTGVVFGGEITVNANPTLVDIGALSGWLLNYDSSGQASPGNPTLTYVEAGPFTGVSLMAPLSQPFRWFLVDSSGVLSQQLTRPTPAQRRTYLVVGAVAQVAGTVVAEQTLPAILSQPVAQTADLMEALGSFNIGQGNLITPNGPNLSFNKSAGSIFARGFAQDSDYLDPHTNPIPAAVPCTFRHITATVGSAGAPRTTLDVANYDPNGSGVLTALGGGSNTSTNMRVWGFPVVTAGQPLVMVQYGQRAYASLSAAVAGIGSGEYVRNPVAASAALLGWITTTRTTTNASTSTQAVFRAAGNFDIP